MKNKKPLAWIPLWIDKHLFGSTRLELEPDERGVWIDLLALSGKDSGFIRANKGVPYPPAQLAGMLVITEELLERTIEKCLKIGKLKRMKDGTLFLPSWKNYSFSERHKRRFVSAKTDTVSEKPDMPGKETNENKNKKKKTKPPMSEKADPIVKNRIEQNRIEKNKKKKESNNSPKKKPKVIITEEDALKIFDEIWNFWWRKEDQGKAKEKFLELINKGEDPQTIKKACIGYLRCEMTKGTGKWFIKYLKTFLYDGNEKRKIPSTWRPYIKYGDDRYKLGPKL